MFERFNINDLYLAHVVVSSPESMGGYGYLTILKKSGENYIDLQNMDRIFTETRNTNNNIATYGKIFVSPIHCLNRFLFDWYNVW